MSTNDDLLYEAVESICGHLSQRTAVLFLGAGVNYGTKNVEGIDFPLAYNLAEAICRDLLAMTDSKLTLDDAAEIVRYQLGDEILNNYLYQWFDSYAPNNAHLAIAQLPWDVIYTTNYDLLVEKAASSPYIKPAGLIRSVCSTSTDLTAFVEEDIIYYKLHGTVDLANSPEGRLIITKDDYRHYRAHRKPLFQRLRSDLSRKTLVFVGYSFADSNFRAILDDCREELGMDQFPLSYAIRPNFTPMEAGFWRDKYNIQLVSGDAFAFLTTLRDSWQSENRTVVPFEERRATSYTQTDQLTRFPKVGESFYRVTPSECNGSSNPKLFFRGAEPTWADIRDAVAPRRDAYVPLMEGLFADFADPASPISVYLVTGHAGTGKTTLVHSAAYEVAKDYGMPVLIHIPGTPLDARLLIPFIAASNAQRVVIIVHHAADYVREIELFADEVRRRKLPVSIVLEERKNQWIVKLASAVDVAKRFQPAEIELGALSRAEIHRILEKLRETDCLGRLTGTPEDIQEEHFIELAQKELLVALRELTGDGSFDEIIRNEFDSIPSEVAKQAYVYVAALGQIQLPLRYEVLSRLLTISPSKLGAEIFRPTDGILITGEATGSSRHNAGFRLRTRHPVIASIIFAMSASDDEAKFKVINAIMSQLDPGYPEDRRLLEGIVKRRELVNTLGNVERRRDIYDTLAKLLPNSAFVFQHRSMLERELRNADLSVDYARRALALDRRSRSIQNTLGLALEFSARNVNDLGRRRIIINEADRIFRDGIARNSADPYSYIGRLNVLRFHELELEADSKKRDLLHATMLSLLEEAFEATNESPMIAGVLAEQRERMGEPEQALKTLMDALILKPEDTRLRDMLLTFLAEAGKEEEGLKIALAGIKFDPNSWRLQRHAARFMINREYPVNAIQSAYEAALRHKKDDIGLYVEFGAFLFMNGLRDIAKDVFEDARKVTTYNNEKRNIKRWWKDTKGARCVFSGKVKSLQGASAYVLAVPTNFEAFFWRTESWLAELREGDPVQFQIGFNAFGPNAHILVRDRR